MDNLPPARAFEMFNWTEVVCVAARRSLPLGRNSIGISLTAEPNVKLSVVQKVQCYSVVSVNTKNSVHELTLRYSTGAH